MKSFPTANKLEELLNQVKKIRKMYQRIEEQAKDDTTTFELFQTLAKPIVELEKSIMTMQDELQEETLYFLKETIEWNDKHGRSNDYLLEMVGKERYNQAISLK